MRIKKPRWRSKKKRENAKKKRKKEKESNLALKNLFHSYGNVTSAKVLPSKSADFEAKAGFVEFSTLREAESAIRNLNGSRIGKYTLKVSFARSKKKEKSEYMDLIQKLELGPLIDADLKCLIKKTEEEMEEAKLEVNGEGDGCRGSSSKSSQGSKSPERETIPHFNNSQDVPSFLDLRFKQCTLAGNCCCLILLPAVL